MMNSRKRLLLERRRILLQIIAIRKIGAEKKYHVREIFQEREEFGAYYTLIPRMREHDISNYVNFLRITPTQLDFIVNRVAPSLTKRDTNFRKSITPGEKVCLTFRYLASGDSMRSLSYLFRLGYSTVSMIIAETTAALWESLLDFICPPQTEEDWSNIAKEFEEKWNFPHCLGAIDGKHVVIQAPSNSETLYYNYKNSFSIVLMAICDANYLFTIVNVCDYGHHSDSGVFSHTDFGEALYSNAILIPPPKEIEGSDFTLPHVFIADEAFPLKIYMLCPYSAKDLNTVSKIFNYRLSRARRVIENAFGILSSRWRVLRKPVVAKINTIENIVKACCILHNYIIKDNSPSNTSTPFEMSLPDDSVEGLLPLSHGSNRNYSLDAAAVRDGFAHYFSSNRGHTLHQ